MGMKGGSVRAAYKHHLARVKSSRWLLGGVSTVSGIRDLVRCNGQGYADWSKVRHGRSTPAKRRSCMNYTAEFKSIKGEVSAQEWQARLDLAACYRLIDKYGMTDLIYNHITARIPGAPDHLLINLYGLLYKEITASSLVKISVEGDIIWKPDT